MWVEVNVRSFPAVQWRSKGVGGVSEPRCSRMVR